MAWQVKWTFAAWNDLENIVDFIAKDSNFYAASLARETYTAARSLQTFAERGRLVPEFHQNDIRELFIQKYRLIYQITEKTVNILAVIHGARDIKLGFRKKK